MLAGHLASHTELQIHLSKATYLVYDSLKQLTYFPASLSDLRIYCLHYVDNIAFDSWWGGERKYMYRNLFFWS